MEQERQHLKNEIKLETLEMLSKEKERNDGIYAIKLVEKIVFSLLALVGVAVVGALIRLVIIN